MSLPQKNCYPENVARLRTPFVITVAVASLGCSGADSSGSGANKPAPVCPTDLPADGAACEVKLLSCEYDGGNDGCNQRIWHKAFCTQGGSWSVTTPWAGQSCNPPPPPLDECPVIEPSPPGAYCNTIAGLVCTYPSECGDGGAGVKEATCSNQAWSVVDLGCG